MKLMKIVFKVIQIFLRLRRRRNCGAKYQKYIVHKFYNAFSILYQLLSDIRGNTGVKKKKNEESPLFLKAC